MTNIDTLLEGLAADIIALRTAFARGNSIDDAHGAVVDAEAHASIDSCWADDKATAALAAAAAAAAAAEAIAAAAAAIATTFSAYVAAAKATP